MSSISSTAARAESCCCAASIPHESANALAAVSFVVAKVPQDTAYKQAQCYTALVALTKSNTNTAQAASALKRSQ
jgi:hypothetical protein